MFWSSGGGRRPAAPPLLRMAQIYAERFADPDGRIRATFDVIWPSRPGRRMRLPTKPLRPGSAKAEPWKRRGEAGAEVDVVIAGLDPAIHHLREVNFFEV